MPRPSTDNTELGPIGTALISGYYAVYSSIVRRLDEKRALRLGAWMHRQLCLPLKKKRLASYRNFFGTDDPARDEKIDAEYLDFMTRFNVENIHSEVSDFDSLRSRSEVRGKEHLEEALKLGRGVVLLNAHLGNFYRLHQILSLHGFDLTYITRRFPLPSLEDEVERIRNRFGFHPLFVNKDAARGAMKTFRKKGILSILFDVAVRHESTVRLPFGAGYVDIDPGPALLVVRAGVPVLTARVESEKPFHHRVTIEPPLPEPRGATEQEKADRNLETWRDWLQGEVRRRPGDWWAWSFVKVTDQPEKAPA